MSLTGCLCVLVCSGEDFYGLYDAQNFAHKHAAELGMQTVPSLDVVYTDEAGYVTADVVSGVALHPLTLCVRACVVCRGVTHAWGRQSSTK